MCNNLIQTATLEEDFEAPQINEKSLVSERKTRIFDSRGERIRTFDPLVPNQMATPIASTNSQGILDTAESDAPTVALESHSFATFEPQLNRILELFSVAHVRLWQSCGCEDVDHLSFCGNGHRNELPNGRIHLLRGFAISACLLTEGGLECLEETDVVSDFGRFVAGGA